MKIPTLPQLFSIYTVFMYYAHQRTAIYSLVFLLQYMRSSAGLGNLKMVQLQAVK